MNRAGRGEPNAVGPPIPQIDGGELRPAKAIVRVQTAATTVWKKIVVASWVRAAVLGAEFPGRPRIDHNRALALVF